MLGLHVLEGGGTEGWPFPLCLLVKRLCDPPKARADEICAPRTGFLLEGRLPLDSPSACPLYSRISPPQ